MSTPQLAERPQKVKEFVDSRMNQMLVLSYVLFIAGTALMFAAGFAATSTKNDHTNILYGWMHGSYVIPGFVASIASDDYAIYQNGGGGFYDFAYLIGVFSAVNTVRLALKR
jgi:hypothetical protein